MRLVKEDSSAFTLAKNVKKGVLQLNKAFESAETNEERIKN